jgi:hypothetical protein
MSADVTYLADRHRRRIAGRPTGRRPDPCTELTAVFDRAISGIWQCYLSGCVTWERAGEHHNALVELRDGRSAS